MPHVLLLLLLAAPEPLTLERIMAHPHWISRPLSEPYWSSDGLRVLASREQTDCEASERIEVVVATGVERVLGDEERSAVDGPGAAWSVDRTAVAWASDGDLFVRRPAAAPVRRLTRTLEAESAPQFLLDGRLAFRRGTRLVVRDLDSGLEADVADLRSEDDPDAQQPKDGLERDQVRLFEVLRAQAQRGQATRRRSLERGLADPLRASPPFFLGKETEIQRLSLSPTGRHLLVVLSKQSDAEGRKETMPAFVTSTGHVETRDVRAKVGHQSGEGERLVLIDLERGTRHDVDLAVLPGFKDDPLAPLRRAAEARAKQRAASAAAAQGDAASGAASKAAMDDGRDGKDRAFQRRVDVQQVAWSERGERLAVQFHSHDNKDRWIAEVALHDGKLTPVHHLHDAAWINWRFNELGWLPDDETLWYLSEESGWSHLMLQRPGERRGRALTCGRHEVSSVSLTRDGRHAYFVANDPNPGIHEVFRVGLQGGPVEQVTHLGGRNDYVLSPDESQLLVTHSTAAEPPELYVQDAAPGGLPRRLTTSTTEGFRQTRFVPPQFVSVPSAHGAGVIRGRLHVPPPGTPRPAEGWPAVLFIHGAGYLQDAHQGWSGYFRETLFNALLAERGFVVLDLDYRASAGYGRDWRTAIYRNMGGPELEDLRDGVEWLARTEGVDAGRVGAYGGSYGGFLVLMAMFRDPSLLRTGAALRPVTDWAHYNHSYTSNILNVPELDEEAYRRSSPIEFAAGLERPLLICAPMQDDNVHFQDSVRLVQRLIELERPSFEIALYPVEPHGFKEPSSWLDEYRRILALLERHLR